ncbi:hypothetical protein GCM10017600_69040 [Streptosporangium carneum]|uniref:Uncharacterized protein n=1 Tax=Streptosporangium carneum TaxID=47481 RepID=A0A9W6I964_9ACTN|nr:hypothetical protein GCM10017600_69040 [Streptosporangium carneum]
MFAGYLVPTDPARRGAKPPVFPVASIDDSASAEVLAELTAARTSEMDADTVNWELSIVRKAIGWWQRQRGTLYMQVALYSPVTGLSVQRSPSSR